MKVIKLVICLLVLSLIYVYTNFKNYGASFDEVDQMGAANSVYTYYKSGFSNKNLIRNLDYRLVLTRGLVPDAYAKLVMNIIGQNDIYTYHFAWGLLSIPMLICIPLSIYILTSSITWSFFSWFGILTFGRLTGNIFDNSKDMAPTIFISIMILYFIILLRLRTKKPIYTVGTALLLGTFASLRFGLFIMLLPVFTYYFIKIFNLKDIVKIMPFFIFSWIWQSPGLHYNFASNLVTTMKLFIKYSEIGLVFFEGKYLMSNDLPRYYLPKYILLSTPEYLLIGLLIVSIANIGDRQIKFVKVLLYWPIFLAIILSPNLYDGWRHFLFLSPEILILGIYGIYKIRKYIIYIFPLFLSSLYFNLKLWPYEYSYFNLLSGGYKNASLAYETEFWGGSFKAATEWLNENADNLPVYSCVPHLTKLYLESNIEILKTKPSSGKYLYTCYNRLPKYNYLEGQEVFKIVRQNVTLHEIKIVN